MEQRTSRPGMERTLSGQSWSHRDRSVVTVLGLVVLLIALAAAPAYLSVPGLLELQQILELCVFAVATNLLLGYGGLVSFGQAAFYGVGSYTIAATWLHWRVPFWIAFIGAPVLSAIAALLVGLIALRARKLYFALLTLA